MEGVLGLTMYKSEDRAKGGKENSESCGRRLRTRFQQSLLGASWRWRSRRPAAQAAPTLQEQLAAQYKLVKMGSDTSGYSVVEEGTLLAAQKGGVMGVPYSDKTSLNNKYENGTVHGPSAAMTEA